MGDRHLIIGNGAAGATAADTIREHDASADITIVGAEKVPFYSRPGLAYILTGHIPERQLFSRPDRLNEERHIRRITGTVQGVEAAAHKVVLDDGRTMRYDRLLIAVGARAVRPELPGIDLDGVVALDDYEGTLKAIRLAAKARRAVVVGGGITALELAEGLAARGVETHYLMRGDRYWSNVLEPAESTMVEDRLTHDGIRLHKGQEIAEILGRKGKVTGVKTKDGTVLPCEMVGVAIGVTPRLELAHQIGLPVNRGILTGDTLETDVQDIFAAGDVAEALDAATGKRGVDSLWSVAMEQGRAAGHAMAGQPVPYRRPAPFNVTKIGGITTTIIGGVGTGGRDGDLTTVSRGDSFSWRERLDAFAVTHEAGANRIRLLVGEDRLMGAVVMGDQTHSRRLQQVIRARLDIRHVRQHLLEQPAELGAVLAALLDRTVPGVA